MAEKTWPIRPEHPNRGLIVETAAAGADRPPRVVGYGSKSFNVQEIPRGVVVDMIRANHYSHTVVMNSRIHLGVFMDGEWVGALQFGYLKNPRTMGSIVEGTEIDEYLELNRMWLADAAPRNSESQAISCSIRYIKAVHSKVKWIQSFADSRCGGLGVVYQASNFLYCGSHKTVFYELDGEYFHTMHMTIRDPAYLRQGTRARRLQDNRHRAKRLACTQFRYIYFIDRREKARLRFPVLPYPKPEGWKKPSKRRLRRAK